ncbi:MAG: ribosomal RNA small subunit methyltransferase A [FCB group bacterium]|nr:ribosomal RNA small subunit methyltransferase A [FCB group bacterium]
MVRAKKSLGQHFLFDPVVVSQIIDALGPRPGETILEIGPGEGVLTLPLVNSGANIIAVELDRRLAPKLEKHFEAHDNFRVIEADILSIDPREVGLDKFSMIGNLPYNITTPIMDWLLANHNVIDRAVLMMQKEVALRVSSPPGKRSRSTISVLTSLFYDGEAVVDVPPEAFRPPPKVDSAVVRFVRHDRNYDIGDLARFEKFVRFCFAGKRKNLLNNLNSAYPLPREDLDRIIGDICGNPKIRAEQLELETFIDLSRVIFECL